MIEIYTDGGCRHNPGPGAWAFIVVSDNEVIHQQSGTKPHTTNNEMELTAILESLKYLKYLEGLEGLEDTIIFSDSEYSVNAINIWYNKWLVMGLLSTKKNISLIKSIKELKGDTQILWTKAHSTNPFNNLADRLVNQAMDAALLPPESSPPTP